jgi:hypothetical protein
MPGSTAAVLVSAGSLVVWLLLDVRGFRSVLARGWHDQLGRTVMTISGMSCADKTADGESPRCLRLPRLTPGRSPLLARSWPGQLHVRGAT